MRLTALVLAGTRSGGDPLAAYAGVSHKALIEIGGRPMIERVLGAIAGLAEVAQIVVVIERPELLAGLDTVGSVPVRTMPAGEGPSASVAAAFDRYGAPLLVTTADHALLQTAWLRQFLDEVPPAAAVAAALARRESVEAAVPDTRRTYLRFREGAYSGCNLFMLAKPAARAVVCVWRELERDRKKPWRMMRKLGWGFALRYALGMLSLSAATDRLSRLAGGAGFAIVELRDGRAAIDVDKPADLDLVRRLVRDAGDAGGARR